MKIEKHSINVVYNGVAPYVKVTARHGPTHWHCNKY